MSKKQKPHIKSIINKESIDKAPADFTSKVMQDVFVLTNEEALKDATLSSLLKGANDEKPSHNFLSTVMTQVTIEKEIQYQPLISKKAWVVIFTAIVVLIVSVFFSEAPKESSSLLAKASPYIDQAQNLFTNPFKNITFSPLLAISLLCLSSMLLFDTLLKRKLLSYYN